MANFRAITRFSIVNVDLNAYDRFFVEEEFALGSNLVINDVTYPDFYGVRASDGFTTSDLLFFGSGFTRDVNGLLIAGTVSLIAERDAVTNVFEWAVQGVSLDTNDIYAAALTLSNLDERALIGEALAGDDTIILSDFNDLMMAFGGNDSLDGGAGNDVLDGGAGDDTVIGGVGVDTAAFDGSRSNYVITREGADFRVIDQRAVGGTGNDLVSGVETFLFTDGLIASTNLVPNASPPQAQTVLTASQSFGVVGFPTAPTNAFITGTAGGAEFITIGDFSTINLSNNFTSGGDTIRLAGLASDFDISVSGNQVTFASAADQITVKIPTGFNPITILFETAPGDFGDIRFLGFFTDGADADLTPDLFLVNQRVMPDVAPIDVLAFA